MVSSTSSKSLLLHVLLNLAISHAFMYTPTTPIKIKNKVSSTTYNSDTKSIDLENNNDTIPDQVNKGTTRVVVVGGGVGGLAVASRLASSFSSSDLENVQIILLEKNSQDKVGGRCGSFEVDVPNFGAFRHERGPSLLLLKDTYQDLFVDCHSDMNNFSSLHEASLSKQSIMKEYGLEIKQCLPAYQVVFEDGDSIQLGFPHAYSKDGELYQLEKISRQKMDEYEENGSKKWDEYMRACSAFLDCGLPNFIEERLDLKSFPAFVSECLRDGFKSWPLKAHSDVLDATFKSNKMKTLSSFQDLYVGLEPYRNDNEFGGGVIRKTAPAVFGLLSALELHPTNDKAGVFAPIGGFQSVSNAFERLATKCGVDIRYDTTVTHVDDKGVWFVGENNEGTFLSSDLTLVNADLPFATKSLINSASDDKGKTLSLDTKTLPRYDWDDKFEYSSGVIAFHWSLDMKCKELDTHNVFLVANSRSEAEMSWSTLRNGQETERYPFNFYVHRATATDATAAPDGCDSIMVLVPCGTLKRNDELAKLKREQCVNGYKEQFDSDYQSRVRDSVLKRLSVLSGLDDIGSHIVHEVVDTPADYADLYNLGAGTPFALSHGFGQLSLTRPSQQSSMENVLFVGASTRPGNGVPLVLLGAEKVAEKARSKILLKVNADREKVST